MFFSPDFVEMATFPHGKKILTKIAWTRVLLMRINFTYFTITTNLKQMLESMHL